MLARRPDSSRASCRLPTCGDREVSRRPQSCPTRLVRQAVRPAAAPKRAALAIPGRVRRVGPSALRAVLGLAAVRRASAPAARIRESPCGASSPDTASRPARPSRRVRRTAFARLSPLGARSSRPLLTQRLFLLRRISSHARPLRHLESRRFSRSGGASRPWPGGADSRARGAQGSPVASVFSLAEAHSAEGNVLSRSID